MSWRDQVGGLAKAALQGAASVVRGVVNESTNRDFDDWLEKAARGAQEAGNDGTKELDPAEVAERQALHFDPFDLVSMMGYRERPSPMTYQAMERVGRTVPVLADIVKTRTDQVVMFCQRQPDRHASGFEVRPRDPDAKYTKKVQKRCTELEEFLLNCGRMDDAAPGQVTSLVDFAKMFIPDSLIFDQGTFEVVPDRKGRPAYFAIVDPSTIRLLDPGYRDPGDPFAVQVINGSIVADFKLDELAFCVRNPRSGIRTKGYGFSEIESLVREITGFLWSMDYNRRFFTQGSATRGILNFKGSITDKQLRAFRRHWYAMVSGVHNAWRTPVTNAEELQWVSMQMSNRDMEYSAWMDFLIKVSCSRYNIATEEVGFQYGNTGQSQAMGQAPFEEKIKASKDLGLRPLVVWFFRCLTDHLLSRIDPAFEAVPVGLDAKGEAEEAALLKEQTSVYMTIDEAREAADMEPIGEERGGNVIENQIWLQWFQGQQAAQQQQQAGQGGPEDPNQGYDPQAAPGDDDGFGFQDQMDLEEPEAEAASPAPSAELGKSRDRPLVARYTLEFEQP